MKINLIIRLCLVATIGFSLGSCLKSGDCYDEALYQAHKNDICPQDCPGVVGCDGKVYCNECMANAAGVRVER